MKSPSQERLLAVDSLSAFFSGKKGDNFHPDTNARVNQVYNIVYGVLRKHHLFNGYLDIKLRKKPPLKVIFILQLAMFELVYNRSSRDYAAISEALNLADYFGLSAYKGLINAVLRNIDFDLLNGFPVYPEWIMNEIRSVFAENSDMVIDKFQSVPPLFLTINTLRITVEEFLQRMRENDIVIGKTEPFGYCCKSRRILETGEFRDGLFLVQDLGAQMAVEMLLPFEGMNMLDLCSAPGGKSLRAAILAGDNAAITAVDKSPSRLVKLHENINKTGLKSINVVNGNPLKTGFGDDFFDRVIVDPPCSALGVMGRHPDVLINRSGADLKLFADLQYKLLFRGIESLKQGGRLVYSVCTFTETETVDVIEKAIGKFPGIYVIKPEHSVYARGDYVLTMPNDIGMDAHFIAVLGKR
ncbi:MAG: RsmB/NOP family class I SAM-dependent RNA methyltransferase [Oligoflexia bacterium]|nr:RsmB/NOP family class I SAM-dependent RNA methyltransferase [Oligoflexia bacterium]